MEKPAAFQAARQMIRASSNGNAWEVGMTQFRDDPEIGSGIYGLYIVYIYGLCMVVWFVVDFSNIGFWCIVTICYSNS